MLLLPASASMYLEALSRDMELILLSLLENIFLSWIWKAVLKITIVKSGQKNLVH